MGVQVVEWLRAHATCAVDPGLNPEELCCMTHTPLSPIPVYLLSNKGVYA